MKTLDGKERDIGKLQVELFRQMTPGQRFEISMALSSERIAQMKAEIARTNPDASKRERDLLFIKHAYGEELVEQVRQYMDESDKPNASRSE